MSQHLLLTVFLKKKATMDKDIKHKNMHFLKTFLKIVFIGTQQKPAVIP